jgi:hypothetical protein
MSRIIERNCPRRFGCSYEEALLVNGGLALDASGSMAKAYSAQRYHAAYRGVAWEMTFLEWAHIWTESGLWERRGKLAGCYCMARHGDTGPYAAGNVSIQPVEVNNSDGRKRATVDLAKCWDARRGSGRGWSYDGRRAKPYIVRRAGKYLGAYATQLEAEAVYASAP